MPGLKADAREVCGVSFHWRDVRVCAGYVLDIVKEHLRGWNMRFKFTSTGWS